MKRFINDLMLVALGLLFLSAVDAQAPVLVGSPVAGSRSKLISCMRKGFLGLSEYIIAHRLLCCQHAFITAYMAPDIEAEVKPANAC